jgi:chromosomal replication initiator protein
LDVSLNRMDSSSQAFHSWREALEHTRALSPVSFEQWFASVQFEGIHDGTIELVARDEFVRDWVKTHFQPTLLKRMRELAGVDTPDPLRVEWRISSDLSNPVCQMRDSRVAPRSRPSTTPAPQRPPGRFLHGDSLNAKHTFPNFVVGPSNELAYAAACASAGEGGPRYNPLFLCGGTGLGKTHLMHAIAHRVLEKKPDARVVYVSAERFTNEFIEALQHHKMDEFRSRYRSTCDLLLLDDIQSLAGREQTQEEFFHTFNALRDADKPIVVSSDKYPQELQRMP